MNGEWKSGERGVALIVALLVIAILVAVTLQFTYTTTIDLKLVRNQSREVKSYYAARGVVALAVAHLREDQAGDGSEDGIDSLQDSWAGSDLQPGGDDETEVFAGGGFSRSIGEVAIEYKVVDEDRKIPINNLIVEKLTYPDPKEEREPDAPEPPGGEQGDRPPPGGNEKEPPPDPGELAKERREQTREFLRALLGLEPFRMEPGDADALIDAMADGAPFASIGELSRIEGMTDEILHGTVDEFGRRPGLVDFLTVHSKGQINLNTAPPEVLKAILKKKYGTEAGYYASSIVEYRTPPVDEEGPPEEGESSGGDGENGGGDDEEEEMGGIFEKVEDLPTAITGLEDVFGTGEPNPDPEVRKAGLALQRQLTVRSSFFSVKVTSDDVAPRKEFNFVLRRGGAGEPIPVLSWEEREIPSGEEEEGFP